MSVSSSENFTNDHMAMNTTVPPHVHMAMNTTVPPHVHMHDTKAPMNIFVVATLVSLFVCVMNPLTIVTILRTPSLRRCHSNIFLINLAVVDLSFMLLVLTFIANNWLGSFNSFLCILAIVNLGNSCSASMLFCFAIAVDRFLFIHKALTYSTIVTHGRVVKVVASIWMASCLIGLLPIMDGKILRSGCQFESSVTVVIQSMTVMTLYFITAIISICLYTKLFFVIRDHNKVLESHAMTHSRPHSCGNHACTVTTRLGECRFRHHNHSSFTWPSVDCPAKDARVENTSLISNHRVRCSASSLTSGISTARSHLSTNEDDVSVSLVDQPTGQASRVYSQHAVASCSRDLQDTALAAARQVAVAKEAQKKRHTGQCQHLRDLRTIKALMMMFAVYFICWAPVMAMKIQHSIFHMQVSERWMNAAWICVMSNSVWNFLVYPLRKKDFRDSMFKMVRRCLGLQADHRRSRSLPADTASDSVQNSLKKSSSYASRLS